MRARVPILKLLFGRCRAGRPGGGEEKIVDVKIDGYMQGGCIMPEANLCLFSKQTKPATRNDNTKQAIANAKHVFARHLPTSLANWDMCGLGLGLRGCEVCVWENLARFLVERISHASGPTTGELLMHRKN